MDLVELVDYREAMKLEEIKPGHCLALANQLLADARAIREEMGRSDDTRLVPEISGAEPRECFFEAIVAWRKAARLASEVGAEATGTVPASPRLRDLKPGHVHGLLEGIGAQLAAIKRRLAMPDQIPAAAADLTKQPSDVLVTILKVNRELSRSLERPFTPSDVYRTVALASAYATRLGATPPKVEHERRRKPADCYERLEGCLTRAAAVITKRGGTVLAARGTPADIVPGDVYDLANLVLCELAYLHELTADAQPLHAFEPSVTGHRLPSHVHQLARTLEAQLATLS